MSKYVPTYYDKVCAVCGVAFVTSYKKGKYCGPICAKEGGRIRNMNYQRQKRMIEGAGADRICLFCGKTFRPNSGIQKYCPGDCARKAQAQLKKQNYNKRKRAKVVAKYEQPTVKELDFPCPWHEGIIQGTARYCDPVLGF